MIGTPSPRGSQTEEKLRLATLLLRSLACVPVKYAVLRALTLTGISDYINAEALCACLSGASCYAPLLFSLGFVYKLTPSPRGGLFLDRGGGS